MALTIPIMQVIWILTTDAIHVSAFSSRLGRPTGLLSVCQEFSLGVSFLNALHNLFAKLQQGLVSLNVILCAGDRLHDSYDFGSCLPII